MSPNRNTDEWTHSQANTNTHRWPVGAPNVATHLVARQQRANHAADAAADATAFAPTCQQQSIVAPHPDARQQHTDPGTYLKALGPPDPRTNGITAEQRANPGTDGAANTEPYRRPTGSTDNGPNKRTDVEPNCRANVAANSVANDQHANVCAIVVAHQESYFRANVAANYVANDQHANVCAVGVAHQDLPRRPGPRVLLNTTGYGLRANAAVGILPGPL